MTAYDRSYFPDDDRLVLQGDDWEVIRVDGVWIIESGTPLTEIQAQLLARAILAEAPTTLDDFIARMSTASTADEARDLAIDFQHWQSGESLAYSELAEIQQTLETLSERFPTLTDEFRENGLI